jgi:dihydrofolate synthase/folylpolyglutamate synthase
VTDEELYERAAMVEAALATRWPESRIEPSLDRITELLDLLGNPQRAYPVILVAGTNGKTSVARMVASVLDAFGLSVGRFTSPHLTSVTERIAVGEEPVDAARFVDTYVEIAPYLDLVDAHHAHPLSFFEVITALGYAIFADAPVDVAVVEVGMGGTWDATNVVDPAVSVVTPVGLDHQDYLGDTIEEIAAEKAGVVKEGGFVVLADQEPEAAEVLGRRAADVKATVVREGVDFGVAQRQVAVGGQLMTLQGIGGTYEDVFLPLHGVHQARNASVALAVVEEFLGGGRGLLDLDTVRTGFAAASSPGRLEIVRRSPTVLLDAAHNPAGARALAAALEDGFSFARLVAVVAVLRDKDAAGLLEALSPVVAEVVVTQNGSPRALDADTLGTVAVDVLGSDRVEVVPSLVDAIERAVELAESGAPTGGAGVLVTGSVVTVAEARRLVHGGDPVR